MKQLTCEMCGSTDLVKDGGVFVCKSCGCKYSVEEAKKMMIEGTVDVSGSSVKIDKSDSIETYLKMAEAARKGSNYLEAERYANKVLEIQPENAEAWYIKGCASGWQSSGVNYRFKEVLDCFEKYINLEPNEEKKNDKRLKCDINISTLIDAMTMLRCETFETVATEETANEIFSEFDTNIRYLKLFHNRSGYTETYEQLVKIYNNFVLEANSAFVNVCDESDQRFGPNLEDKSDGAFRIWINEQNLYANCFHTLLGYIKVEETLNTVYNNLKSIRNSLLNSWSYEMIVNGYSVKYRKHLHLNDESKQFHNKQLAEEKEIYQETKEKIKKEKAISKKKRVAAYWERHPQEKETLDHDKADVEKRLNELRQERSEAVDAIKKETENISGTDEIEQLKKEVEELQTQKSALGIFKSKEKKELQQRIDELENKIKGIETRIKEAKKDIELRANRKFLSFEKEIQSLEQHKSEIEKELTTER